MKQIQKLIKGLSIEELDDLVLIVQELDEYPDHKEELIKMLKYRIRELELVDMMKVKSLLKFGFTELARLQEEK